MVIFINLIHKREIIRRVIYTINSILKKGKIREERINREFKDKISDMDFELVKNNKFVV